jgi:BirA family biotin operon repressor/biotin-[acetyl-CoA-carboxylase] ligase
MKIEKLKIKDAVWDIIYFDEINSTQKFLLNNLENFNLPVCIWSEFQTDGIGSRGNKWLGERGNLFFSFAIKNNFQVPMQSFSIFFAYIMKKTLEEFGTKLFIKWPNDLYSGNLKKVCGVLTNLKKDILIVGIGLNSKKAPSFNFDGLEIEIKNDKILKRFLENIFKFSWEEVIKEYKKEFNKTKSLFGIEGELEKDGSLRIKNKKVYSKR